MYCHPHSRLLLSISSKLHPHRPRQSGYKHHHSQHAIPHVPSYSPLMSTSMSTSMSMSTSFSIIRPSFSHQIVNFSTESKPPINPEDPNKATSTSDNPSSTSEIKQDNHDKNMENDTSTTSKKSNSSVSSATARAASALGSATLHYTYEFNKVYSELEKSMFNKINESNKRRIRFIFVSLIVGVILLFAFFGSFIKKGITDGTADIAKETLENESLKIQTQELARAVVQTILNDKDITSHAAGFLREASNVPETQAALLQLTLHVLQHPDSLKEVGELVKKLLKNLAKDPEAIDSLAVIFTEAIKDPRFNNGMVTLFGNLSEHPEIIRFTAELFAAVMERPEVIKTFTELLSQSSQSVLVDERIISQSREFVADVMGDDKIQREGGDAIWNSISHALRPGLKKLGGIALVCGSVAVAQLLLSPY